MIIGRIIKINFIKKLIGITFMIPFLFFSYYAVRFFIIVATVEYLTLITLLLSTIVIIGVAFLLEAGIELIRGEDDGY